MRKLIVPILLTCFVATCDSNVRGDSDRRPSGGAAVQWTRSVTEYKGSGPEVVSGSNVTSYRRHRNKTRRRRCRRYVDQYQYHPYRSIPQYVPQDYNGVYGRRQYVLPSPYVPSWCNNYCYPCATSGCRRRCPTDVYPVTGYYTTGRPTTRRPRFRVVTLPKYSCNCDPAGSQFPSCNVTTGNCFCKSHYIGKSCSECEDGYWKNPNKDCVRCTCNGYGTLADTVCNKQNGECSCKPGVTGKNCDQCLPFHYGNIETGCKKCDPCDRKGHICDPSNGRCVCPHLTHGQECQKCKKNAWGYEPGIGCKQCTCSEKGSATLQCDATTGRCTCKMGYEGETCDRCSFGYFRYPDCRKCECEIGGTQAGDCNSGICRCKEDGTCRCKANVEGAKCDVCKPKSYGMNKDNVFGCTNCFCFGRSESCTDSNYNWNKIRMEKAVNDSNEINEDTLMLPERFLGDLTTSYGGHLSVTTNGSFEAFIYSRDTELQTRGNKEAQMIESEWEVLKLGRNFPKKCKNSPTRDCFMVVLQNVTSFAIRANHRIHEVLLDKAESNIPTYPVTHSIERCRCAKEYSGLSCQNPNKGYFRSFPTAPGDNWIDMVVGKAKPCDCNGHSKDCDPDNGHCKNCGDHTTGIHCELCAIGYFKDKDGKCAPCLCPNADQNNAESCSPTSDGFICKCKRGYKGQFCDKCDEGYYNEDPTRNSLKCVSCKCNVYGVENGLNVCDSGGRCKCKDGFTGEKCNECVKEREFIKDGICTPCDKCTELLFDEIDKLALAIEDTFKLFKDGLAPPWKLLTETVKRHDLLSEKFKSRQKKAERLLKNAKIDELEAKIDEIDNRLAKGEDDAENNKVKVDGTLSKSNRLLKETERMDEKLQGIVSNLKGFGTKQVDLNQALDEAKNILGKIRYIYNKFDIEKNKNIFDFCSNVSERVHDIYKTPDQIPQVILDKLKTKLNDVRQITSFIEGRTRLAEDMNANNSALLVDVKADIEKLKSRKRFLDSTIGETVSKIEAIGELLEALKVVYDDLTDIENFAEMKELEKRVKRQEDASAEINELYERALNHVRELEDKINSYQGIFNFTKDEWKKINASGAFEAIITGIRKAKELVKASQDILAKATFILEPENADHLVTKTNLAHAHSDRLKKRITNIKDISKNLVHIKNQLDDLKYSILQNGKSNNELSQILHKMEQKITSHSGRVDRLEEAIENSTKVTEEMNDLLKKADKMHFEKEYIFFKKYQNYLNLTSVSEINNLKKRLNDATNKLQSLNISSTNSDDVRRYNNLIRNTHIDSIQNKIDSLQKKITFAKQAADMISVAMNLNGCRMTYHSEEPEFFRSLSVTFKCKNCDVFKWSHKMEVILGLRVENYRPVLSTKGKNITLKDRGSDEQTINIRKTGSYIQIDEHPKSIRALFDVINPEDAIEIGSLNVSSDGYIFKVFLNEQNFGVWKYSRSEGNCTGQRRDISNKPEEKSLPFFNGRGYKMYGGSTLKPAEVNLRFNIHTFDENSLIYLTTDRNCSFISLYLEKGHVVFQVVHTYNASNVIRTSLKYNDGEKHSLEITMQFRKGKQKYKLDIGEEQLTASRNLTNNNVFKIKRAEHYIGGVPPTFNKSCISTETRPFLGFLELLGSHLINETLSYGVLNKKTLEFTHMWINRTGEIEVNHEKEKIDSLSFFLRPTRPDGIIMKLNEHVSLHLVDYTLNVGNYNDTSWTLKKNDYNSVQLERKTLTINNYVFNLDVLIDITIDKVVKFGDAINGFEGGIKDVIINDNFLMFTPQSIGNFTNVEIGRDRQLEKRDVINIKSLTTPSFTNSMQNTEGCTSFSAYRTDPDAVKFGDKPNSYISVQTDFWRTNFEMRFEFRTFYPDGLVYVSYNSKNQHYALLELKEGRLHLSIKGKSKKAPISFSKKLNDGQWHNIQFVKKKRKLSVTIDKERKKPFRIPKFRVDDRIYLGGVPVDSEEFANMEELRYRLIPFKGCMRALEINDEEKVLIKRNKNVTHSNIRQCFPNIEEGAYFGGDAYAIYRDDFRISKILELTFEFRTGEQNGMMLSVSNNRNSPALSVQLNSGGVVMAVDNGNGLIVNVTNDLDSEFALCDNRWHKVTAMYSSFELTVNVDGIRKSWVLSDAGSLMDEVEAPLYIGGIPDNAPIGTLKSRENFRGCIRKLMIDEKLTDWSDMKSLSNVMLNSCPLLDDDSREEDLETTNYTIIYN